MDNETNYQTSPQIPQPLPQNSSFQTQLQTQQPQDQSQIQVQSQQILSQPKSQSQAQSNELSKKFRKFGIYGAIVALLSIFTALAAAEMVPMALITGLAARIDQGNPVLFYSVLIYSILCLVASIALIVLGFKIGQYRYNAKKLRLTCIWMMGLSIFSPPILLVNIFVAPFIFAAWLPKYAAEVPINYAVPDIAQSQSEAGSRPFTHLKT